ELVVEDNLALGSPLSGTTVKDGATLRLSGATAVSAATVTEPLALEGASVVSLIASSGANTWSGPITLTEAVQIETPVGGHLTLSGVVSGSGSLKLSQGQLTLTNANTHTGGTFVDPGCRLVVRHAQGLGPATSAVRIDVGATLDLQLQGDNLIANPLGLAGSG